jgi:hypothetical protein
MGLARLVERVEVMRSVVGLARFVVVTGMLAGATNAHAEPNEPTKQPASEEARPASVTKRLDGGALILAAVGLSITDGALKLGDSTSLIVGSSRELAGYALIPLGAIGLFFNRRSEARVRPSSAPVVASASVREPTWKTAELPIPPMSTVIDLKF